MDKVSRHPDVEFYAKTRTKVEPSPGYISNKALAFHEIRTVYGNYMKKSIKVNYIRGCPPSRFPANTVILILNGETSLNCRQLSYSGNQNL